MDGLFMIATADGVVTEDEMTYLQTVSEAFGFSEATFRRIKAGHMGPDRDDPYHVLGVALDATFEEIRRVYRRLMAANHPDRYCLTSVLAGYEIPQIDCPEDPLRLRDDDIVVAASDGLEFLSTEQINTVIQDNRDKQSAEISAALLREVDRFDDPDQDNVCLCVIKTCRRSSSDADRSPSGSQESRASKRSSMTVVSAKTENGSSIYRISRKVTVCALHKPSPM